MIAVATWPNLIVRAKGACNQDPGRAIEALHHELHHLAETTMGSPSHDGLCSSPALSCYLEGYYSFRALAADLILRQGRLRARCSTGAWGHTYWCADNRTIIQRSERERT